MGQRLRLAIDRAGLMQRQVADTMNVSERSVRNWVADRHRPEPGQLLRLADVLGVDPGWLLTGSAGLDGAAVLTELRDLRAAQRELLAEVLAVRRLLEAGR